MANHNTQTSISTLGSTAVNKSFYDKNLLATASTQMVYSLYGQQRPVPRNAGKKVEMRRWSLWDPSLAVKPLSEGETPDGLSLEQDVVEAELRQYGAYFTYSDLLDMTSFDEILSSGTDRLGEMLGSVVEWVTRDELVTGNNVNWAGGATSRATITANDKLTCADIRKAVRDLKKRKARMFEKNGHRNYLAIVSPDAVYDLQNDPLWQSANMYVNNDALYSGELGRLFGVVFLESTEAPVVVNALNGTVQSYAAASRTVTLAEPLSAEAVSYLQSPGAQVLIHAQAVDVSAVDATANTITLAAAPTTAPAAGDAIRSRDGSDTGVAVHQTVVFGQDAYGTLRIGPENVTTIVKKVGEGGFDPLNQRGTVGGKVTAYAARILNEDWILRIEHAATDN